MVLTDWVDGPGGVDARISIQGARFDGVGARIRLRLRDSMASVRDFEPEMHEFGFGCAILAQGERLRPEMRDLTAIMHDFGPPSQIQPLIGHFLKYFFVLLYNRFGIKFIRPSKALVDHFISFSFI